MEEMRWYIFPILDAPDSLFFFFYGLEWYEQIGVLEQVQVSFSDLRWGLG